jgi:hypothetical protein
MSPPTMIILMPLLPILAPMLSDSMMVVVGIPIPLVIMMMMMMMMTMVGRRAAPSEQQRHLIAVAHHIVSAHEIHDIIAYSHLNLIAEMHTREPDGNCNHTEATPPGHSPRRAQAVSRHPPIGLAHR